MSFPFTSVNIITDGSGHVKDMRRIEYTPVTCGDTTVTRFCVRMVHKMRFKTWLSEHLEERNWTYADLAKQANVGKSTVSMIMSGQRTPGPDFCLAISDALNVPPVIVFQRAGLLPSEPVDSPSTKQATHLLRVVSSQEV